jgi:hypothetical protein
MKRFTFSLGLALIFIGLAISEGINYLDLRQFEIKIFSIASVPSAKSSTYQLLRSPNEFSKSLSPEIFAVLVCDYSTIDNLERELQTIHDSVSRKKSQALGNMNICLLAVAVWSLSAIRKSRSKQV